MKQCKDYLEQISAYADGELTTVSEIREVAAHLKVCKNCEAFYAFSQEIKTAISIDKAQPPRELVSRVMNQITSEPTPIQNLPTQYTQAQKREQTGANTAARNRQIRKKPRTLRVVMTRIMPIAASLALVIIVWQFWGDLWQESYDMETQLTYADPAPAALEEATADFGDDIWSEAFDEPEPNHRATAGTGAEEDVSPESMENTEAFPSPQLEPFEDSDYDLPPISRGIPNYFIFYDDNEDFRILFGHIENLPEEELEFMHSHIAYASFIIAITGDLPYMMDRFAPMQGVELAGWDTIYDIPTEQARLILSELVYGGLESKVIEQNIENPYAIILFSREDRDLP